MQTTVQMLGLLDALEKQATTTPYQYRFPKNMEERSSGQGTRSPMKWDPNDASVQQQLNKRMDDAESMYNNNVQSTKTSREDFNNNVYKLNNHLLQQYGGAAPRVVNYGNYDPRKDDSASFPSQYRVAMRYMYPEQYRQNKYGDPDEAYYSSTRNQIVIGANNASRPGVLYHEAGHFIDDESQRQKGGIQGVQQQSYNYYSNPEKKLKMEQTASDNGAELYKKLSPNVNPATAYNTTHAGLVTYYPKANAYSFSKGFRNNYNKNLLYTKDQYDDMVQNEYVQNRYDLPTQASNLMDNFHTQA